MVSRRAGPWLAALALAFLAMGAPLRAFAQQGQGLSDAASFEDELTESRRRLDEIQRERADLRREMQALESRVHDISSRLELVSREVDNSTRMLSELEFQLERQQERIDETTTDLDHTRDQLARQKTDLNLRLRDIYKRGPLRTVQVLLGADSFSDLLNRYKYLSLIARYDRQLVRNVAALETRLIARERLLSRTLAEIQELREARASEHEALEVLRVRQSRALSSAQQEQESTSARLRRLEEDAQRLASLIDLLETRRREAEAAAGATAGTLTPTDAGTLVWPVDGRLIYPFGRQTQPNGTVLRWNGIGIAAAAGSSVRSVAAGTAVLAGPFEGYGPTVVLSHGGGYYSLYLYLDEIRVQEGDAVANGQVLGTVGGARTPQGPHIEFQIRSPGGEAVDPLGWLRRRSP